MSVIRYIVACEPGLLERVELPPASDPRIRSLYVLKQSGDPVQPPFDNADQIG